MLTQELTGFIRNTLVGEGTAVTIDDATPLIENGIVDSMGLMQIVAFIEERTGIRVPDDEIAPDNFETVGAISQLVERLQGRRAGGR